ncbi:hypothetical protein QAD02_009892 [Eretmocerus hayati]|uniref:Uncharacterized protein n=1 Tax=Eretmocerus hayati TaxID=131215 RepID=A0ACC2NAL0_9HYME|nr:hypothetical protein QAD02_009892 [Eretmocerus hayati]
MSSSTMDNSDDGEDEIGGNETIDVDVMDFVLEQAPVCKYTKQKHRGHKPKKATTFTIEQVHTFVTKAEEPEHLLAKAIFVVSLSGCLRRVESTYLLLGNVTKLDNGTFLITIPL